MNLKARPASPQQNPVVNSVNGKAYVFVVVGYGVA
jgi:hypothetical protein